MQVHHRTSPDGVLAIPRKGDTVPECPEGYVPDPLDPQVFHLDTSPCEHRSIQRIQLECRCGFKNQVQCGYLGLPVNMLVCHKCNPEWLERQYHEWHPNNNNSVQGQATTTT